MQGLGHTLRVARVALGIWLLLSCACNLAAFHYHRPHLAARHLRKAGLHLPAPHIHGQGHRNASTRLASTNGAFEFDGGAQDRYKEVLQKLVDVIEDQKAIIENLNRRVEYLEEQSARMIDVLDRETDFENALEEAILENMEGWSGGNGLGDGYLEMSSSSEDNPQQQSQQSLGSSSYDIDGLQIDYDSLQAGLTEKELQDLLEDPQAMLHGMDMKIAELHEDLRDMGVPDGPPWPIWGEEPAADASQSNDQDVVVKELSGLDIEKDHIPFLDTPRLPANLVEVAEGAASAIMSALFQGKRHLVIEVTENLIPRLTEAEQSKPVKRRGRVLADTPDDETGLSREDMDTLTTAQFLDIMCMPLITNLQTLTSTRKRLKFVFVDHTIRKRIERRMSFFSPDAVYMCSLDEHMLSVQEEDLVLVFVFPFDIPTQSDRTIQRMRRMLASAEQQCTVIMLMHQAGLLPPLLAEYECAYDLRRFRIAWPLVAPDASVLAPNATSSEAKTGSVSRAYVSRRYPGAWALYLRSRRDRKLASTPLNTLQDIESSSTSNTISQLLSKFIPPDSDAVTNMDERLRQAQMMEASVQTDASAVGDDMNRDAQSRYHVIGWFSARPGPQAVVSMVRRYFASNPAHKRRDIVSEFMEERANKSRKGKGKGKKPVLSQTPIHQHNRTETGPPTME